MRNPDGPQSLAGDPEPGEWSKNMQSVVTLVGNTCQEPELRYTPGGQPKAEFSLAVNRRWQDKVTNEWQEATSFFRVVAWRELAENLAESLGKGARVVVVGRLEQRSWETPEGEKRSIVEVVADEVSPSLRWATAKVVRNERTDQPAQLRSAS